MSIPVSQYGDKGKPSQIEERLDFFLQMHEKNHKKLSQLQQNITALQAKIKITQQKVQNEKRVVTILETKAKSLREAFGEQTIQEQLAREKKIKAVFNQIQEHLNCKKCKQPPLLPLVAGPCGHSVCTDCLVQKEADKKAQNSGQDPLETQKCFCGEPILGNGIPVVPLKKITTLLTEEGVIEMPPSEMDQKGQAASYNVKGNLENELQIAHYAEAKQVTTLIEKILNKADENWKNLDLVFNYGCSRLFYSTAVDLLKNKLGFHVHENKDALFIIVSKYKLVQDRANTITIFIYPDGNFLINK